MLLSRHEEASIGFIGQLHLIGVADRIETLCEGVEFRVWHLESGQHAAEVCAVIAIVEQADIPASAERFEELQQRPRPLGKLEAADPFVHDLAGAAADHVADVELGKLVLGEIDGLEAAGAKRGGDVFGVAPRSNGDAEESPAITTSAPSARTASTLMSGVVHGITISACSPRCRAENATPCA